MKHSLDGLELENYQKYPKCKEQGDKWKKCEDSQRSLEQCEVSQQTCKWNPKMRGRVRGGQKK